MAWTVSSGSSALTVPVETQWLMTGVVCWLQSAARLPTMPPAESPLQLASVAVTLPLKTQRSITPRELSPTMPPMVLAATSLPVAWQSLMVSLAEKEPAMPPTEEFPVISALEAQAVIFVLVAVRPTMPPTGLASGVLMLP